jgi:uncharacterized phage protein gp47/JayE
MTLPAFLNQETEFQILQRMLDRIPDSIDKSEGSYIYDALAAVADEVAQAKIDMGEYLKRGFASTTFGSYLDLRCEEHGLTRRPAAKSSGTATFAGTPGTLVPSGFRISTPADEYAGTAGIEFQTLADCAISEEGTINAAIQAVEPGSAGNVAAGTINILISPIAGIASVVNHSPIIDGADVESDASLLSRYLAKVQAPGTSGNKADYRNWAREIPGVGDVQIIPLWNGNGTVKVVLVNTDKQPPDSTLVAAVQDYIAPANGDGLAPIGASVTVVAAEAVNINVTATVILTGTKTLAEVKAAFEQAFADYLKSIVFANDSTVRYVRIGSLLLDTEGIQDYSNLQVNGGTGNVGINTGQIPVKGTVTLNG